LKPVQDKAKENVPVPSQLRYTKFEPLKVPASGRVYLEPWTLGFITSGLLILQGFLLPLSSCRKILGNATVEAYTGENENEVVYVSLDFSLPQTMTSAEDSIDTNTERGILHHLQSERKEGLFAFLIGEGEMTVSGTRHKDSTLERNTTPIEEALERWGSPRTFNLPSFKSFYVGIVLQRTGRPTHQDSLEEQLTSLHGQLFERVGLFHCLKSSDFGGLFDSLESRDHKVTVKIV